MGGGRAQAFRRASSSPCIPRPRPPSLGPPWPGRRRGVLWRCRCGVRYEVMRMRMTGKESSRGHVQGRVPKAEVSGVFCLCAPQRVLRRASKCEDRGARLRRSLRNLGPWTVRPRPSSLPPGPTSPLFTLAGGAGPSDEYCTQCMRMTFPRMMHWGPPRGSPSPCHFPSLEEF